MITQKDSERAFDLKKHFVMMKTDSKKRTKGKFLNQINRTPLIWKTDKTASTNYLQLPLLVSFNIA